MKPHEMRAAAKAKLDEAERLFETISAADRDPTDEETKRHDALISDAEKLTAKAKEAEARDARIGALSEDLGRGGGGGRTSDPLPHQDPTNTRDGQQPYSLLKAMRQALRGGADAIDGLEAEVSKEMAKRSGKPPQGFYVPWDLSVALRRGPASGAERRDLTTTTGAGGVYEVVSSSMIELLRNAMLSRQLGISVMANMNGNFSLPKHTGTSTAYWVTEGNAPTESNPTIGAVDFAPSTVGAFTDYSRKFLMQTSIDAENFIRQDLTTVIALELDRVVFNGSGTGAEPEGIIPNTSVNVVALGANGLAPTRAHLVAMIGAIDADNALNGTLSFVTSAAAKAKLMTTEISSSTALFTWGDANQLVGYPAYSSNQIPANLTKGSGTALSAIIFGDWSKAVLALWSGLDVLVDPYTGGTAGNVRIVTLQDADFQVTQPESFAVIKDAITV